MMIRLVAIARAAIHVPRQESAMALWTIWANYDSEAKVWYTCDSDVPGLVAEGATLAELERRVGERFTDMLEGNAHLIVDKSRLQGPHEIRLVAFAETRTSVAA